MADKTTQPKSLDVIDELGLTMGVKEDGKPTRATKGRYVCPSSIQPPQGCRQTVSIAACPNRRHV